jgi:hypothetical protein
LREVRSTENPADETFDFQNGRGPDLFKKKGYCQFNYITCCRFITVLRGELMKARASFFIAVLAITITVEAAGTSILNQDSLASAFCGNDKQWYLDNVPIFDCPNSQIKQIYYYRWMLYKSHLRNLGAWGYIVTEFLNNMSWDIDPYSSLNDATGHHIYEGRWIKDKRYLDDYINYMYQHGGNDRHFSEGIADAAYARYLANKDSAFIVVQLNSMKTLYTAWNDHRDASKSLYWIEPIYDAEEYTIASCDASGGTDGFLGGMAFRPSINSYMYGNALAISKIATLAGDAVTASTYQTSAAAIKTNVQNSLWNTSFVHFVDRYQVTNTHVTYWNYVRGRELVGYVPWQYNLPDNNPTYSAAWQHLMDASKFLGTYGLRTLEPSYQYYMKQYRYDAASGKPECQWNGPSWPYLTTQVLDAMANLLNNYTQTYVTASNYLTILKLYAAQHFQNGSPNIEEDYNANTGAVIVDLAERSQHYNHSQFTNLIITGLCGLRPRAEDSLVVNPLIPSSISDPNYMSYFCLENIPYHGHFVTILYDGAGIRYGQGAGLSIFVDEAKIIGPVALGRQSAKIGVPVAITKTSPINLAINLSGSGNPVPSASYTNATGSLYQANDGRIWYWTNTVNRWSCLGSGNATDWYAVNFGSNQTFNTVKLYFYAAGTTLQAPTSYTIQTSTNGTTWTDIPSQMKTPATPLANTVNTVIFTAQTIARVRALFTNQSGGAYTALTEMEVMNGPVTATGYNAPDKSRSFASPVVRINADRIFIQRNASDGLMTTIRLFTINGKLIYTTATSREMVKYPKLNPGMYLVTITSSGQQFAKVFTVPK